MIDLHSHILPGMDDGAKNCDASISLIKSEIDNGVDTIALTPHFICERENVEIFLARRLQSFEKLKSSIEAASVKINLILAAEVLLNPQLLNIEDLSGLCYEGTDYMLVELPYDYWPDWVEDVLYKLRLKGVIPLLAHIERYSPIMRKPELIEELVSTGALAQINTSVFVSGNRSTQSVIFNFIESNLIHILATDTHSIAHRPPLMKQALSVLNKRYGPRIEKYFISNSLSILNNEGIESVESIHVIKNPLKRFFHGNH